MSWYCVADSYPFYNLPEDLCQFGKEKVAGEFSSKESCDMQCGWNVVNRCSKPISTYRPVSGMYTTQKECFDKVGQAACANDLKMCWERSCPKHCLENDCNTKYDECLNPKPQRDVTVNT